MDRVADKFKIATGSSFQTGADDIPWYYPLEGDFRKAQTAWDSESIPITAMRSFPYWY